MQNLLPRSLNHEIHPQNSNAKNQGGVIFRPHGRKSRVITRYFPSVMTEIYKHLFAIFCPHGRNLR